MKAEQVGAPAGPVTSAREKAKAAHGGGSGVGQNGPHAGDAGKGEGRLG